MERFTVKIVAEGYDQDKLNAVGEDLAWEAATSAAQSEGIDIGSEEFIRAFNLLKSKFSDCAEAYGHIRYTAAATLRSLMDAGMAVVYPPDLCACDEHMKAHFDLLVGIIFSQATSIYAVGPAGWLTNEEWERIPEEHRTLYFNVIRPNIPLEEEDDITYE
jgi:hypothetical protein